MNKCKIIQDGNDLVLSFPYDAGMVAALKSSIPASERRYDPANKTWRVTLGKAAKIQNLCHMYFNELPLVPQTLKHAPQIKQSILDVRYIGLTKNRGGDDCSAFGWHNEGWNVLFPESILRSWFDAPQYPDEMPTLYSVLAITRDASEDEIKAGYRRMARQWHTDYCKEPNAHEQMLAINHAYEVLNNINTRERYDAGLAFELSLRNAPQREQNYSVSNGYRSPLRCGLIMCEGKEILGVFNVSKIFAWEDIRDANGRVLVVSWKRGEDTFEEAWV